MRDKLNNIEKIKGKFKKIERNREKVIDIKIDERDKRIIEMDGKREGKRNMLKGKRIVEMIFEERLDMSWEGEFVERREKKNIKIVKKKLRSRGRKGRDEEMCKENIIFWRRKRILKIGLIGIIVVIVKKDKVKIRERSKLENEKIKNGEKRKFREIKIEMEELKLGLKRIKRNEKNKLGKIGKGM